MMDHLGLKLTKQMLTNKFIASIKYTLYLNEWHWILMNVTVNIIALNREHFFSEVIKSQQSFTVWILSSELNLVLYTSHRSQWLNTKQIYFKKAI